MARPGYVEAREEKYKWEKEVRYLEQKLAALETPIGENGTLIIEGKELPPVLIEFWLRDARRDLANARTALEQAEQDFARFNVKSVKLANPARNFSYRFNVCVSVDEEMYQRIMSRQKADQVGGAELVRRALNAYLV